MTAKAVMHGGKFKRENLNGLRMHNERKSKHHSNQDIDPKRTYLNYSLVDRPNESYAKQIESMLNSDRKPRKDAVYDVEFVFSSDRYFMHSLSVDEQRQYFTVCRDYIADKWGQDRLLYANVHLDETTPHMHLGAAPIDQNGHLNAKKMFNKSFLTTMQKELPEKLKAAGFDIEKGQHGGVHTSKRQWEKVTKKANEQVISQLAENFPNDHHSLCDKNGKTLYETDQWGLKRSRNSHAWGTPEGQKELHERSLDANVFDLTYATNKRVKTADKAVETSQEAKESADAERKALADKQKQLAVDNARADELSRKALAAQKKADEEKAKVEKAQAANDAREASLDKREDGLYSREMALDIRERGLDDREGKLDTQEKRVTVREDELHAAVAAGLPYVMGKTGRGRLQSDVLKSQYFVNGQGMYGARRPPAGSSLFDALVDGRYQFMGKTGTELLFSKLDEVPAVQRQQLKQDVNQAREKSRQTTETATTEPEDDGPEL